LTNVKYGDVAPDASVGTCIRNAMVNMFVYNAVAPIILDITENQTQQ